MWKTETLWRAGFILSRRFPWLRTASTGYRHRLSPPKSSLFEEDSLGRDHQEPGNSIKATPYEKLWLALGWLPTPVISPKRVLVAGARIELTTSGL